MKARPLTVLVSTLIALTNAANAVTPLGDDFQVNTTFTGNQNQPSIASFPGGGFVVVWDDYDFEDINDTDVLGQRFDSLGARVGAEFLVNTYTDNYQDNADVASAADGSFIVVWMSRHGQDGNARGVFGQRYDSSGAVVAVEFQVNTTTENAQRYPSIGIQPNGDFVVVWGADAQDGMFEGVFGQRFSASADKLGAEFQVNSHTFYSQWEPEIAVDGEGDFVVVWTDSLGNNGPRHARGQRFDSAGTRLGAEFAVNSYTGGNHISPAIAADADGDFVVAWTSYQPVEYDNEVLAQRFTSSGERSGVEFRVNTVTAGDQYTTIFNFTPQAVALESDGDFVVVWTDYSEVSGISDLFGQAFSSTGDRVGAEFQVNAYSTESQNFPSIAMNGDGKFVVTWESWSQDGNYSGIFARRFSLGESTGPILDIDGDGLLRPLTDGVLLLRDLSGFTGPALVAGALGEACTRCEPEEIEAHIVDNLTSLDIDGSGETEQLSDGVLVIRYLFGFRQEVLVGDAPEMDCTRCNATLIEEWLDSLD